MKKANRLVLFMLTIITSVFPLFFWFQPGKLIYLGDLNYPLNPLLYWLTKLTNTWIWSFPGGSSHDQAPSLLVYQGIPALLSLLHINLYFAQILFYVFWLAVTSISFIFFAERLRRRLELGPVFTYTGVVLYQFNIYRMIMFGDAAHTAIYAAIPLVLGLLLYAYETKLARWAALAGLAMVVASPAGANPPMYVVFLMIIFVVAAYFFFASNRKFETIKQYGLFAMVFLFSNLFWMVPFVLGQFGALIVAGLGQNNLANWVDSVSVHTSWYNVLRLQGAWDWYAGFNNQPYVAYSNTYLTNSFLLSWSLLLPAVAIVAIILRRKYWTFSWTIAFLGVAGFFLSMGTHQPATKFFQWLILHIPLFWMFRSPWYKFGLWQAFATVILVSIASDLFITWAKKHFHIHQYLFIGLGFLAIVASGVSVYPFINGLKFPNEKARLNIPEYVISNSNVLEKSATGEILLLPSAPAFNYKWKWSGLLDPLFFSTTNRLLYTSQLIGSEFLKPSRGWLFDAFAGQLYSESGTDAARGILAWLKPQGILQRDDLDYNFYGPGKDSPEFIKARLSQIGLTKTDPRVVSPWHLYRTGYDSTPVSLNYQVFYTPQHPTKILPFLAELNLLDPDTVFISDQDNLMEIEKAGIPYRQFFAIEMDKPLTYDGNPQFELNATSGKYRLLVKQAETSDPRLLVNAKKIVWEKIGSTWWRSSPIDLDFATNTLSVDTSGNIEEHALAFNQPQAWVAEDVDPNAQGAPNFSNTLIVEEKNGVKLSATGHRQMFKTELVNLAANTLYRISFDYKTDANVSAEYSVHLANVGTAITGPLPASSEWKRVDSVFRVKEGTAHTYLNLFSYPATVGVPGHQSYRNVSVQKVTSIEQTIFEKVTEIPDQLQSGVLADTQFNPTRATTVIPNRTRPGILTFNQEFSSLWQLRGVPGATHIKANWYANAWIIPAGKSIPVAITFSLQRWFILSLIISIATALIILWAFIKLSRRIWFRK